MISILKSSWLRIAFQSITGGHKRNGGFKRLLQQELLDQFDRFLEL
jgi:hypothetical protein